MSTELSKSVGQHKDKILHKIMQKINKKPTVESPKFQVQLMQGDFEGILQILRALMS